MERLNEGRKKGARERSRGRINEGRSEDGSLYIYIFIYIYICVCVCIVYYRQHIYMYIYIYANIHIYIYEYIYIRIYIYIYIYIHTHIYSMCVYATLCVIGRASVPPLTKSAAWLHKNTAAIPQSNVDPTRFKGTVLVTSVRMGGCRCKM
jgi:hypothetical protein